MMAILPKSNHILNYFLKYIRLFGCPKLFSQITGIRVDFIENLAFLLRSISSSGPVDIKSFEKKSRFVYDIYAKNYSLIANVKPTVHKLLVHGSQLLQLSKIPLGSLSEQALESRNKYIKKFKLKHTFKSSRENINKDLFNSLTLHSWPNLSCCQNKINDLNEL